VDPTGELFHLDGFDQEVIGADLEESGDMAAVFGRDADDGQGILGMVGPDGLDEVEAVEAGHVVIGDDQAEVGVRREDVQGLLAVLGFHGLQIQVVEQRGDAAAEQSGVVGHQHAHGQVLVKPFDEPFHGVDFGHGLDEVVHHVLLDQLLADLLAEGGGHDHGRNIQGLGQGYDGRIRIVRQVAVENGHEDIAAMCVHGRAGLGQSMSDDGRERGGIFNVLADDLGLDAAVFDHQDLAGMWHGDYPLLPWLAKTIFRRESPMDGRRPGL